MNHDLSGKKALITGGTSGLGKEIALAYAKVGASVVIFGTNETRAKETVVELNQVKVNPEQTFSYALLDVSKNDQVQKEITALLEKWSNVDILVNCAGVTRDNLLMKMEKEDWDTVIGVNLTSVYNLCHSLVRSMLKARSGVIINITSVVGMIGNAGQSNYAASKSGMIGFTRSLAKELGSRQISVNCIAPGFFQTKMTDVLPEQVKKDLLAKIPMKRLGDPKEIAHAALFLATATYITGQTITVDGGMLA